MATTINKNIEKTSKENVYDIIFKEEDVTWQSMIYELARAGKINPWDIDVSELAKEYLQILLKLKEMNFQLSGKVVLAAAILLKLKSDRLGLAQLLALTTENEDEPCSDEYDFENELLDQENSDEEEKHFKKANLQPRIPGVRKRKVTLFELVSALKTAIDVDTRRRTRISQYHKDLPEQIKHIQKTDILERINQVYRQLVEFIKHLNKKTAQFTDIIPSKEKQDIIRTFVPLLHLANQRKIKIIQKEHFGNIYIELYDGHRENKSED